jgi:hypothetical protein
MLAKSAGLLAMIGAAQAFAPGAVLPAKSSMREFPIFALTVRPAGAVF